MKKLLTLFLVIGVMGIYGQTTEADTTLQIDSTQKADIIKINEQDVHRDTSNITENTSDTIALKDKDNLSSIGAKKNPWLYDWRYGCLTDGLTYLIPMITLYSIAERVDDKFLPLDNYCTPCIYPIGFVLFEKMWKNTITTKEKNKANEKNYYYSFSLQKGIALPYYSSKFEYQEGALFPNIGFLDLNFIGLSSNIKIGNNFNVNLLLGVYNFYINGPSFYSIGTGIEVNDFNVSMEKVFTGYYNIGDIPEGVFDCFITNNYGVKEYNNHYIVNFKYDFWGIGIGWGKKYKIWKELYIEPKLSYKFMYTFDFESGCVTGFIGGLGIGYKI